MMKKVFLLMVAVLLMTVHINLDNTGRARVHVIPDDRGYIDYEGTVSAM